MTERVLNYLGISSFYIYPNTKLWLCHGCSVSSARNGKISYSFKPVQGCRMPKLQSHDLDQFIIELKHHADVYGTDLPSQFGEETPIKLNKTKITDKAVKCRVVMPNMFGGDYSFRFQFDKDSVASFNDAIQNVLRLQNAAAEAVTMLRSACRK